MKSSNLAERLEELDAGLACLRLGRRPPNLVMAARNGEPPPARIRRRPARLARIITRDDGLRPFRVR
jgi:hypothetical protein